jgi:peptidoglycan hydrolase-like protein with peptidoglycan-binding domain
MKYTRIAGIIAVALIAVPVFTSALTADDLNAQVVALLSQIAALQKQMAGLPALQSPVVPTVQATSTPLQSVSSTSVPLIFACPLFTRTLSVGSRGDDVYSLQQFLIGQQLLTADSASGYFGAKTQSAVQGWQSSHGVVASGSASTTGFGVVGGRTRGLIALSCQSSSSVPVATLSTSTVPIACAVANPPLSICSTGWKPIKDSSGCAVAFDCATSLPTVATSTQNKCPLYSTPTCASGSSPQSNGIDYNGCPLPIRCAANTGSSPKACTAAAVAQICGTGYVSQSSGVDSNGCALPAQCVPQAPSLFTVTTTIGTAPLTVVFSTQDAGLLNFGDGQGVSVQPATCSSSLAGAGSGSTATSCTLTQTTHVYPVSGTYRASLTKPAGYACQAASSLGSNQSSCARRDSQTIGTLVITIQ